MTSAERVLHQALSLTSDQREMLAVQLFLSLDRDPGYELAWAEEIARRVHEIETGGAVPISGEEVLARLEQRLVGRDL
jgi:putative addiction module component (TIGR02574 family)